ncbi:MAG: molecular chaperone HtpG, partial [Clostridia bacterium]|nr:molecular chaperone HtpG [Clostridia bacterium]
YQKDYQKGLQLYCNGVLIMDSCADLLPDYFGFIKGVIDSSDLSLNISREMLQQDRQLRAIGNSLEKKIIAELKKYMQTDREGYDKFFSQFGLTLKFGVYNSFGLNKEKLKDLIQFHSSSEKKLVTLSEYVSRMTPDQKFIFYACGDGIERIDALPQTELIKEKGYEILYMPDSVDEFVVKTLGVFEEKEFKSVGAKDLGLESEEEKEKIKEQSDENKELFDFMCEALDGEVKEVRLSSRMKSNAVCLTADGEVSLEMEKVFKSLKTNAQMPVIAEKVLEINANHKILDKLKSLFITNRDEVKKYAKLLYATALITEGMEIENPAEFVTTLGEVLAE